MFTIFQVDFYHVQAHAVSNISLHIRNAVNNRQQSPKKYLFCLIESRTNVRKSISTHIFQHSNIIFCVFCAHYQRFWTLSLLVWAACRHVWKIIARDFLYISLLCKTLLGFIFLPSVLSVKCVGRYDMGDIVCAPFRCKWWLLLRLLLPLLFNVKLLICPT